MAKPNSPFSIQHSLFTIPLVYVALSFALNLYGLATNNLWEDEIFTALFASRTPGEVLRWTASDIHPPLYYLLAGTFARLTLPLGYTIDPSTASDWLWRFPSVGAAALTVAITYKLAYYLERTPYRALLASTPCVPRLTAISAALLLALAPSAIKYGQEARMHALFMCFSALSTWLFFRALVQPRRWRRWLVYTLTTAANIYTMYFGFLILATHACLLLCLIIRDHLRCSSSSSLVSLPRLMGFSAATILAGIFYAPWWPVLFNILRKRAALGAIEGGVGSPFSFIPGVVRALGPLPEPLAWGFLALFGVGIMLLARKDWPLAAFAAGWLALPAILPVFLGDPRALQFRYAFVLPIYLLVIGYAVVRISFWRPPSTFSKLESRDWSRENNLQSLLSNYPWWQYLLWILATVSFSATLGIFNQVKPAWREAAAYLDAHTTPNDIILIGPLWDEGRFIDYYYRGQAQLLTPTALVTNIQERTESLRATGGRVWAINRFASTESAAIKNIRFPGLVVSEPQLAVYEPAVLTEAALDLARQAVEAAYPWAAEMEAQGVLNPDPRTAKAGALRAWGDTLVAAGRLQEAIAPFQTAVDIFPGWVNGYLALAETQEALGNLPEAAAAYRQAVTYNLKWHGPAADQAAALIEAGQWAEALQKYHQIIETK